MAIDAEKMQTMEKLPFEECLKRLDQIVREMESGNVPLEQMISRFEEGSAIASICHKKLNSLKQKIELLQPEREVTAESGKQANPPADLSLFNN